MSDRENLDKSSDILFDRISLRCATTSTSMSEMVDETTEQPLPKKDTISFRRSVRSWSPSCTIPRMNSNNFDANENDERKEITNRMSNLVVTQPGGQEDDSYRSITPIPLLHRHQSHMTELSPATLNRLRSCGSSRCTAGGTVGSASNSITNSPCVTEVTAIASNTTSDATEFNLGLTLPTFVVGGGNFTGSRDSPSTSQVSVGSVPPTLTAALLPSMRHHYDLTPVMRNTSVGTLGTNEDSESNPIDQTCDTSKRYITVTPSDDKEYDLDESLFLHGENLAMPSDFLSSPTLDGMCILQPSLSRVGRNDSADEKEPVHGGNSALDQNHECDLQVPRDLPRAVDFPTRKYYSFSSRRQYEGDHHVPSGSQQNAALKPYQPNQRKEEFDIEDVPEEELQRIFIARRYSRTSQHRPNGNNGHADPSLSTEETDKYHRLLHNSIPLDEDTRNWSIPSIRMAQHLQGSIASQTEATELEDEDSLVYIYPNNNPPAIHFGLQNVAIGGVADTNDDLSISSRGSSLCHFDDIGDASAFRRLSSNEQFAQPSLHHPFSIPSDVYSDDTDSVEAVAMGGEDNEVENDNLPPDTTSRHRKRKQQRLKEAYEWLQSVEVDQNVFAEAASSKFLTAGNNVPDEVQYPQQFLHHQLRQPFMMQEIPMQRQISSPAHLSTFQRNATTEVKDR